MSWNSILTDEEVKLCRGKKFKVDDEGVTFNPFRWGCNG